MRILLSTLNSKYIHSNLALKYLYTSADKCGATLELREFTINNETGYIFSELLLADYDMICFSCYIWNIEKTLELCENLKKAKPEIKILLGGPEVSFDALDVITKYKFIDYIIEGEGESTFDSLCEIEVKRYKSEKAVTIEEREQFGYAEYVISLAKLRGLIYRENGRIYVNPPAEIALFEDIPFPYNYFPCEEDRVIYYESVRGCPYNCSYCISSLDKTMRALSVERVKTDIGYFVRKKVKQVKFIDRTFNWDKERAIEIWKYLINTDNGITNFHFELCGELINDEMLHLLKGARKGLFQFEIGIQSTHEMTLKAVKRSSNVDTVLDNVSRLVLMGNIHIHVDLIAGLPHESYDTFKTSFNQVYLLKPDALQLGFLKLLKGTLIRSEEELFDYVYREKAPYEVISNRFISAKDMARLKRLEAVFDLYYNRGGFGHSLEYLVSVSETPFDFYEELTTFYCLKGYQHKSHTKEDMYRILYKYAVWKSRTIPDLRDVVEKLLEKDMEENLNFDAIKKFKRKGWNIL